MPRASCQAGFGLLGYACWIGSHLAFEVAVGAGWTWEVERGGQGSLPTSLFQCGTPRTPKILNLNLAFLAIKK